MRVDLPKLIEDRIVRLRAPHSPGEEHESIFSPTAIAHGQMRKSQGYTLAMLVHDSRYCECPCSGVAEQSQCAGL
jgi:hypothetical protein